MSITKFEKLKALNVNDKVDKKGKLSYLSWSWAWGVFKEFYPDATYKIKKQESGLPYVHDKDTGYMVFTEVTAGGETHEMWLPVMDGSNKAMKCEPYTYQTKNGEKSVEQATMFDINTAIQRCLVKNYAMFGLGLYIYAGEDLPQVSDAIKEESKSKAILDKVELKLQAFDSSTELNQFFVDQAEWIGKQSEEVQIGIKKLGHEREKFLNDALRQQQEDTANENNEG